MVSNPGMSMSGAAIPVPAANKALGQGTQEGFKNILCPSTGRKEWNSSWLEWGLGWPMWQWSVRGWWTCHLCSCSWLQTPAPHPHKKCGHGCVTPGKTLGSRHFSLISGSIGNIQIFPTNGLRRLNFNVSVFPPMHLEEKKKINNGFKNVQNLI